MRMRRAAHVVASVALLFGVASLWCVYLEDFKALELCVGCVYACATLAFLLALVAWTGRR